MQELLLTNDAVLISFVEAILTEAGIAHIVADRNMSIVEGSIGVIPRRILVEQEDLMQAQRLLRDADLGDHLSSATRQIT
ncbi:MAG: DUF2007 domain-containing protein [Hyphomicrobiaceae bacterium]